MASRGAGAPLLSFVFDLSHVGEPGQSACTLIGSSGGNTATADTRRGAERHGAQLCVDRWRGRHGLGYHAQQQHQQQQAGWSNFRPLQRRARRRVLQRCQRGRATATRLPAQLRRARGAARDAYGGGGRGGAADLRSKHAAEVAHPIPGRTLLEVGPQSVGGVGAEPRLASRAPARYWCAARGRPACTARPLLRMRRLRLPPV